MGFELVEATVLSVSSHGLTQSPLVYSRLSICEVTLEEGGRTVKERSVSYYWSTLNVYLHKLNARLENMRSRQHDDSLVQC